MPIPSERLKAMALMGFCAVLAMSLSTGLPNWLMMSVDSTDIQVGLWKVCVAGRNGYCKDLNDDNVPDDHFSQFKACRAGTIISILFSALATVMIIIAIKQPPQSIARAKKMVAIPLYVSLIAAIATLVIYCGFLWPWLVDNFKAEAKLTWSYYAGVSFYFTCVTVLALVVVLFCVAKTRSDVDAITNGSGSYSRMGEGANQPYAATGYPQQSYQQQGAPQGLAPAPATQYTY